MASAAAATASAKTIHGIQTNKINEQTVDEALTFLRIETPMRADLTKRVGLLKQFFDAQDPKDLSVCEDDTACGGVSLTSLPRCPFCGSGEAPSNGAALATNGASHVLVPEPALDRHVAEVKNLQDRTAADGWALAKLIAEGAEGDLFKRRKGADGTVAYKSYEQFASAELGMSRKYVHALIQIAKEFPDPSEEVKRLGTTKLRLLVTAPPEKKEEVLERIKRGEKVGRRQLQAETGRKPDDKSKKVDRSKQITVASIEGKQTVKLYCKPTTRGEFDIKQARPAKKIDDVPWGWLDLANDVRLSFTLMKNAAGEFLIKTQIQRLD